MKMEKWQVEHITKNLAQLITLTTFNCIVKAELVANGILNQTIDLSWLDAQEKQNGASAACSLFYQTLMGRKGAYKVLYKALEEANQSGATSILLRVPLELFSKPLTYLGVSMEVNNFQNVEFEVNGNTLKLHEFLPQVNYELVQRIFRETICEVDFYVSFITKEKKFVLAKNTIPPNPSYYIPRFLSNRIKINKSVFKVDCLDIFVFKKSIKRYELSQIAQPHFTDTSTSQLAHITCRFIYLDENEDWTELKEKCTKVPIHLIKYEADQNQFILEDSSAPTDIIRKLGSRNERIYISEEEFVQQQLSHDYSSSSICICDTPGMGKTFLLANIARCMTEKCTRKIIVFIPLITFAKDFSPASTNTDLEPKISLTNVLSYTTAAGQQSPKLLFELVKAKLIQLDVFFDGFDELPANKVQWMKQVLESITTNLINIRIYITSRPHMRQELEKSLGLVAYDILPFNQQNQVDFLVQFWKTSTPDSDQLSLQNYATSCLEEVNKSLTKNDKEITGIPLLCQLIAEVDANKLSCHSIKRRKISDGPLKLSRMYKTFIEIKINLVSNNKAEFDNIKLVHIWHALKLLFPTKRFHEDQRFRNVEDSLTTPDILRVGIIQKHSNSTVEFIHRTFAEFLVTGYFSKILRDTKMSNIDNTNCSSTPILKLLLKCEQPCWIINFVHPVIVSFFNSALDEVNVTEELKIQAARFVTSISHKEFLRILRACCQDNFYNIFSFMRKVLTKCDNLWLAECLTNEKSFDLLRLCIECSTSQIFHNCIQLFSEVLKLDVAQINEIEKKSETLLLQAARYTNYEAVEYLVDRISLQNQNILELCVQFSENIEKRENILQLLLNKDPTLINEAPDILVKHRVNVRLFTILVKFGANLAAVKDNGNCAMYAAHYMSPSDYHKLVQFLLNDCKAEYLFCNNEKWPDPLPYILRWVSLWPETLELLLNISGIDVTMKDTNGDSLMFFAVKGNKLNTLQQLLKHGLDYKARGKDNRSLLHMAAGVGGVELVRYLLSLKLDPKSYDEGNRTPLHYAADASVYGQLSVIEILVENGANVQAKDNEGQTALHLFSEAFYANKKIIKYLIRKGAEVNDRNVDGNTSLHLCRKEVVRDCLIEMGADMQATNVKGQTPAQRNPYLWKSAN